MNEAASQWLKKKRQPSSQRGLSLLQFDQSNSCRTGKEQPHRQSMQGLAIKGALAPQPLTK